MREATVTSFFIKHTSPSFLDLKQPNLIPITKTFDGTVVIKLNAVLQNWTFRQERKQDAVELIFLAEKNIFFFIDLFY